MNVENPPGIKQGPRHLEDIKMHPVTNIQHRQSNPIVSFLEKGTFGESGAKIEEAATASWFHSLWV